MSPDLRAVPATTDVRVTWVILRPPYHVTQTLVWTGEHRDNGEPVWDDGWHESVCRKQGYAHDGRILAFSNGAVLVADDQGRLFTLEPRHLRVHLPTYPTIG